MRYVIIILYIMAGFSAKSQTDSSAAIFGKALLIPYNPKYYLSDADREIVKATPGRSTDFRSTFRSEADRAVYTQVKKTKGCISLLEDTNAALYNDVVTLLVNTGFAYNTPDIKDKPKTKIQKILTEENNRNKDSRTASAYLNNDRQLKYMKAVIEKPELLKQLASEYGFDRFIFITQFEIKTNYASCLDIPNQVYKREVMLHFTIYDGQANLVAGNFSKSYFPSNENNAFKIIGQCFPELAVGVAESLQ